MKLSEAIALGYPEIGHSNDVWLTRNPDGTCSGCAIGAALWATGRRFFNVSTDSITDILAEHWPWTKDFYSLPSEITIAFEEVLAGKQSIEELIVFVESMEEASQQVESPELVYA